MSYILDPMPIMAMPLLSALREAVIVRSTKRMPKWKFRLSDEIVMRIQPKIFEKRTWKSCTFDCSVVVCPGGSDAGMLDTRTPDSVRMDFRLNDYPYGDWPDDVWTFEPYRILHDPQMPNDYSVNVRNQLIKSMPQAFSHLRPELMLKPSCLMCGKMLTDPVSMARWIGPECAGTSSSIAPYTFLLSEQVAA